MHEAGERIAANIEQVIEGKRSTITLGLAVLLAEGHLLIEDVPGVGKTKFAKALARSIDCSVRRIQFTPDLLPSDVTGVSVYNSEDRDFEFKPGPVFANIVVGDEINRASPKTQAALLECMEERQVTVDGVTYGLEAPFMVLATQNPIDMEGTYPLPEAQRDRFTARISMGYPDRAAEIAMLAEHAALDPLDSLAPVSDATEIRSLIGAVREVYVSDAIKAYAVDLSEATRQAGEIRLGASPRATLQLLRSAKAWAALAGARVRHARRPAAPARPGARAPPAAHGRGPRRRPDHRGRAVARRPVHPDPGRRRRARPIGARAGGRRRAGFTTRATCLLAAGITAILCGLIFGETDLVRAGVLAAAVPCAAAVVVHRSRVRIANRRRVEPAAGAGRSGGHRPPHDHQPRAAAHRRADARGLAARPRARQGPLRRRPAGRPRGARGVLPDPGASAAGATASGRCRCACPTRSG